MNTTIPPDVDPHYSAALDEIYRLRCALAYEAQVTEAHLDYVTFPKSRRQVAEEQVGRMRQAARGEVEPTYRQASSLSMKHCLAEAGASPTLTRHQWENR